MTTISKLSDGKESRTFSARLLCLIIIGTVDFLLMTAGKSAYADLRWPILLSIGAALAVFWGVFLWQNPRQILRTDICLGILAVVWFLILELLRRSNQLLGLSIPQFLPVYLIALPFAAMTEDSRRQAGIRIAAGMYLAAAAYLVVWSFILLAVGEAPASLRSIILWSEDRLRVVHHPNILSRIFMIAICLNMGFLERTKKPVVRGTLLVFTGLLFACLALTNSRACILVTALVLGANVFLRMRKDSWKRLIVALAAAAALTAVAFLTANTLFRWNSDRLFQGAAVITSSAAPPPAPQGSWLADMPTLNNRTLIWYSELQKIQNDPWILLRGTDTTRIQVGFFEAPHSHNAWLEALMMLGLPGLLLSLVFSWRAGWASLRILLHSETGLWKKNISMMILAMMVTSVLEPFLFATNTTNHFFDFIFFLCLGYITLWSRELKG